ncbi:hypothetical protein [Streptomyces mirabilis]
MEAEGVFGFVDVAAGDLQDAVCLPAQPGGRLLASQELASGPLGRSGEQADVFGEDAGHGPFRLGEVRSHELIRRPRERALAYLATGTAHQLTLHDENTRYVLVAYPPGATP